jgi:hypothetical protein
MQAIEQTQPTLAAEFSVAARAQSLTARSSHNYQHWIIQYLSYFEMKNPRTLGEKNVREFLHHLAGRMSLSKARLNQAREALLFLYEKVLHKPLAPDQICV